MFQDEFDDTGSFDSNGNHTFKNRDEGGDEDNPISISFRNNILDQCNNAYQQ